MPSRPFGLEGIFYSRLLSEIRLPGLHDMKKCTKSIKLPQQKAINKHNYTLFFTTGME